MDEQDILREGVSCTVGSMPRSGFGQLSSSLFPTRRVSFLPQKQLPMLVGPGSAEPAEGSGQGLGVPITASARVDYLAFSAAAAQKEFSAVKIRFHL